MESLGSVISIIHIAAAIALLNGIFTTFGQSKVACQAIESIARQPEAANDIRSAMFVGLAMCETSGIYGLLVAIIMLFANPLVDTLVNLIS
ncbi:MAG TPA: ATP synthase F0 subunit C [Clostridiales bacterium]|jgi:F-type H+-transporting ATPase subunit c|nr:ATP synthase F0 subunit C [Clostridiales bacterium]HCS10738.1 ATP synthase F0 subunit C [Clostridiales bacterium]